VKQLLRWGQLLLLFIAAAALAQDAKQGFVFIANEENDLFILPETDQHYTQGLHFSLLWPDDETPFPARPLSWIPPLTTREAIRKFGLEIGQNIYTPVKTETTVLQRDDRPYAGWLYLGLLREDRVSSTDGIAMLDRYELQLGVIGPWSLAADAQNWWHNVIRTKEANGWRNQLENEPGILMRLDRKWRIMDLGDGDDLRLQMLPRAGVALGNVETSARLGAMMRLGYNIPDEFGPVIPPSFGWYTFLDLGARAVLHNEFLDGNLDQDSHHVAKEPVVIELRGGLAFEIGQSEISYTYVYLTREFKLQDKHDAYGSLNYTYRF
jgi:hypothetical protein